MTAAEAELSEKETYSEHSSLTLDRRFVSASPSEPSEDLLARHSQRTCRLPSERAVHGFCAFV